MIIKEHPKIWRFISQTSYNCSITKHFYCGLPNIISLNSISCRNVSQQFVQQCIVVSMQFLSYSLTLFRKEHSDCCFYVWCDGSLIIHIIRGETSLLRHRIEIPYNEITWSHMLYAVILDTTKDIADEDTYWFVRADFWKIEEYN